MYTLPPLSYDYSALQPHIDARTMEIHYTKHHQTYVDKLNSVLEKHEILAGQPLEQLLANLETLDIPDADKMMLRNHGGGHLNHSHFWQIMGPNKSVDENLKKEIETTFGSLDTFKEQFANNANARFGSGWSWLVRNAEGKLEAYSTGNQDSPYLKGHTPIIGLDVWEHAYYLQYQNKRADYVNAWWNVVTVL